MSSHTTKDHQKSSTIDNGTHSHIPIAANDLPEITNTRTSPKKVVINEPVTLNNDENNYPGRKLIATRKVTPGFVLKHAQKPLDDNDINVKGSNGNEPKTDNGATPKRVFKVPSYMAPTEIFLRRTAAKKLDV